MLGAAAASAQRMLLRLGQAAPSQVFGLAQEVRGIRVAGAQQQPSNRGRHTVNRFLAERRHSGLDLTGQTGATEAFCQS